MIISHIIGGMGNQFFQYAAGRYLSLRHGVELKLDIRDFEGYDLRKFELGQLPTSFTLATPGEVDGLRPAGKFGKALQYLRPKKYRTYHRERHFHYDPSFQKIGPSCYLKGNFQSPLYFESIRPALLTELAIPDQKISGVKAFGERLFSENSVSVHIRRTDYTKPRFLEYHGLCPAEYYREAISLLREKYPDLTFYFFSDDMDWVRREIDLREATYVSGEIARSHFEDFYLMSCCRHNIIANSSFSWWAAWLSQRLEKTVIAPRRWFDQGPKDTGDLFPRDWILL